MSLSIESFTMDYLEAILEVWNGSLVFDQISRSRFKDEIISDLNFSSHLFKVALIDQKVVGFIYGIVRKVPYLTRGLESGRGWISIMAVEPSYQSRGIGTTLLETLEQEFQDLGVKHITLCAYSPNYFTPGIDFRYKGALSLFEKHGYTLKTRAVSMNRNLFNFQLGDDVREQIKQLAQEAFTFCSYTEKDTIELLNFVEKHFAGGWTSNVAALIKQGIAEETIIIAKHKEEIIGFCMRKMDGMDARFGPIGVNPEIRGKGIGGLLLELMLENMKQHKVYTSYFLWTAGKNIDFYTKHGFEVYREYRMGEKKYES